jgi:hypothetical protein
VPRWLISFQSPPRGLGLRRLPNCVSVDKVLKRLALARDRIHIQLVERARLSKDCPLRSGRLLWRTRQYTAGSPKLLVDCSRHQSPPKGFSGLNHVSILNEENGSSGGKESGNRLFMVLPRGIPSIVY